MSRSSALVATRGADFRLRRVAGATHGWSVEELGEDSVAGSTSFAAPDIGAAADLLDTSYLASLAASKRSVLALETALRWGIAHRAGDLEAIGAMMRDGSALHDHRRLGIGEVPKEQLLALLDARWETNSVALVAEYERSNDRAILARVVYVGHADWEPIDDSISYTVFEVDEVGLIVRMDVYDGGADGRAAAQARYDEIAASSEAVTPPS